jgi:hypothetical protein
MASETVNIPPTGVTAELYRAAIGPRGQDYYLRQFARFDANGRTGASWHWPAYWATLNWLIYRRMWGWALAYVASLLGLALLVFGVGKLIFSYSDTVGLVMFLALMTAAFILPGLYANAWFYTYCNEKISSVLRSTHEIKEACEVLSAQASDNKRWFAQVSVNVAMAAMLAGVVTFVLNPAQDAPAVAQAPESTRAAAGSMTVATQPVVAAASEVRSEPQPALPVSPPPATPAAAPAEPAVKPVAPEKTEATAATPTDNPVTKVEPVAVPVRPKPSKPPKSPKSPKPAQATTTSADEPAAGAAAVKPVAAAHPAPASKQAPAPKVKRTWFVQVGAFANESNAQNVRAKVEEAGLQTSAEPADTPAGRLTRVRVGPFESKVEADKAALRLKALELPTVLIRE